MTEKDARYCLRLLRDEMPDAIDKALADDPDVVGAAQKVMQMHAVEKDRGPTAYSVVICEALWDVKEMLEKTFGFRLKDEEPGWEYVEEGK